jgi:hypothetical protein
VTRPQELRRQSLQPLPLSFARMTITHALGFNRACAGPFQ